MNKTKGTRLSFVINGNGYLTTKTAGIDVKIEKGRMNIKIYYDFSEKPLQLIADIIKDDKVEIIILPYRIELFVNGIIKDEEWPAGNCLYQIEYELISDMEVVVEEMDYEEKEHPSVIKTFTNAEGWRPDNNVFVGDCMPYSTRDEFHIIYLKDRHHHKSKWGLGAHQWEHISTKDFRTWNVHPTVVKITKSFEGSICTGSWIKRDEMQYMFYTVRMADGSAAPIKRSLSKDGYHYEKDEDFLFTLSDKYDKADARDPKVIVDKDGLYHMLLTTSLVKEKRGCLVHLTSTDLDEWIEEEHPIYISPDNNQPECPDYIEYNGYYYLIFSLKGEGRYLYSKKPFSNWIVPENSIIPCETVPKGAIWNNKIVFVGFEAVNGYAGNLAFKKAYCDEDGELIFE